MSVTKTEVLETLEEIYEFLNFGFEKGYIGNDEPDVTVALEHILGKFKQVLNEMKEEV